MPIENSLLLEPIAFDTMTRVRYSIGILCLAALAIAGCGGGGSKKVSTSNRLVEHVLSDFERLNPYNSTGANETYTEEQIFERLLHIDPKTMEYSVPWLADSLPVESPDHMQFDFHLRKDIKWADGQPFTGADVVFSLKALKNPFNINSAQKRTYVDAIHSAELIDGDPYRVRFKMGKPYFLVRQAAFGDALYILPKHVFDPNGLTDKYSWEDIGGIIEKGNADDLDSAKLSTIKANPAMQEFAKFMGTTEVDRDAKYLQGTGPYKLDVWVTHDYVRLVRNPNYVNHWGELGQANPDTLIYKTIGDWNAAVTSLKSHDIDLMGFLQPQYYIQIDSTKDKSLKRTTFPLPSFTLIGWNMQNPIFSDVKVRWAMSYLIDRKQIIDKLLHGLAQPTQTAIFPGRKEYNKDLAEIPFDPNRAKAILDSAGWKDHDGDGILDKVINGKSTPFHFTFLVNAGNETRKQVLLIISEAMRKVGIIADVQPLEWSVFLDRQRDHKFDARFGAWQQDPFETDNYQLYHSSQAKNRGSNYDYYASPRADKLMEQIREEMDADKRLVLQRELQQVMYEDQPNTFLWVPLNPTAWVDRFDNVNFNSYRPGYNISNWKIRGAGMPKASASN